MHIRTEIKNKVVSMLSESGQDFNIFNSRFLNIPVNKLPAIAGYILDDSSEKSADEGNYVRLFETHIVIYTNGNTRQEPLPTGEKYIDELMDDYIEYVEEIFFNKIETLENTLYRFNHVSNSIRENKDNKDILLMCDMTFSARYHHNLP